MATLEQILKKNVARIMMNDYASLVKDRKIRKYDLVEDLTLLNITLGINERLSDLRHAFNFAATGNKLYMLPMHTLVGLIEVSQELFRLRGDKQSKTLLDISPLDEDAIALRTVVTHDNYQVDVEITDIDADMVSDEAYNYGLATVTISLEKGRVILRVYDGEELASYEVLAVP